MRLDMRVNVRAGTSFLARVKAPAALLAILAGCAGSGVSSAPGAVWRWPEESRPHRISVTFDSLPARAAFEYFVSDGREPAIRPAAIEAAKSRGILQALGTDERSWAELLDQAKNGKPASGLDGAAARSREELAALDALEKEKSRVEREIAVRVSRLLPDSPAVDISYRIVLGLLTEGSASTIPLSPSSGEGMIVDPARLFTDVEGSSGPALADRLFHEVAPDLYEIVRERQGFAPPDVSLEKNRARRIVLRIHSEGPVRYLSFSHDFLPLSRWLKTPYEEVWQRFALRLAHPKTPDLLEPRAGVPFWEQDVPLIGAMVVDSVAVTLGPARLRTALAAGPDALLRAYEDAVRRDPELRPLPEELTAAIRREKSSAN